MGKQSLNLARTALFRQRDGYLWQEIPLRHEGEVSRKRGGFGVVERLLVSGYYPDPVAPGEPTEWIDANQWDFLIYLQTTASPRRMALSYATAKAAVRKCGLYQGLPRDDGGVNGIKRMRRERLIPRLTELGLVEPVPIDEEPFQNKWGSLQWQRLMLAPRWSVTADRPTATGVVKSLGSLASHNRSWFMMPEALCNGGAWHRIGSHTGRRVMAAVYYFFDESTYAAVNPNHLCIRDGQLEISDEFMQACGNGATPLEVGRALHWMWLEHLLFPVASELASGRPHPAGREWVTWSRPVARNTPTNAAAFVPLYLPTAKAAE